VNASAKAVATGEDSDADALAWAKGIQIEDAEVIGDVWIEGTTRVHADAFAESADDTSKAQARAAAIDIERSDVVGDIFALGIVDVEATATAIGSKSDAKAYGIHVEESDIIVGDVFNDAEMTVTATATSISDDDDESRANARAAGIWLDRNDFDGDLYNTNVMVISATALVDAPSGDTKAKSDARGIYFEYENSSAVLTGDWFNDSEIWVDSQATAPDKAQAWAMGVGALAGGGFRHDFTFTNTGVIHVTSSSSGDPGDSEAKSWGLFFESDSFNGSVFNLGADTRIFSYAEGDNPQAWGILFEGGRSDIEPDEGLLVNDSAMIWAGTSEDGGTTIVRDTAIDTRGIESDIHQRWKGTEHWGRIFGDVNIKPNETITVSDGLTKLNGIVNFDEEFWGHMTIKSGGTLFLAMWDPIGGPQEASQVNVETFTQEATGSLWFEINAPPDATPVPAGPPDSFISQINADHADIDGEVLIRVVQPQLFPNTSRYEDVLTANTGTGTWAEENSWTPLLNLTVDYDDWDDAGGGGEIHFDVDRVAFNAAVLPGGYTKNKLAVAGGIENAYAHTLAGNHAADYELLIGTLFTLNAAEYRRALNQLHGSIYAQGLWSVTNSLDLFKRAENARMKYDPMVHVVPFGAPEPMVFKDPVVRDGPVFKDPIPMDEPVAYVAPAPGALWLNIQGTWGDVDGDVNAPGFDHRRRSIHVGADYMFMPELTLGLAVGYMGADLEFDHSSDKIDYDGVQIGGYAKYDWENWYINAMGAVGIYGGDSRRRVVIDREIDPFECGCIDDIALASNNRGDFDAHAWMVSGEFGHRFAWSEQGWIAPYYGLTYQRGRIDAFNERATGTASGSALRVRGSGESLVSDLGFRAGHDFSVGADSIAALELRAAWLHELGDRPHSTRMSFVGAPGSDFRVVGSRISRNTLAFDAGFNFGIGHDFTIGASYNGRFNSDMIDHGVMGKMTYKF
jgi:uncharacterized protein with beta-barrel porin domain